MAKPDIYNGLEINTCPKCKAVSEQVLNSETVIFDIQKVRI